MENEKDPNIKPPVAFAYPFIGVEEEEAVLRVLRSGWLTTGKETLLFEKEFAEFFGEKNILTALAVNSATSGLHLALEACGTVAGDTGTRGIGAGDIVLLPSYTFTATAEVVRYLQAEVVFVDVKAGTFHIDTEALEETLERLSKGKQAYEFKRGAWGPIGKVKAIIPVHYGGLLCDMKEIMRIAEKYKVCVIEDAAHSFPAQTTDGAWAGTIGDAGVFSFYATKTITTGEGGMIVSRNSAVIERMRVMRSHGIDRTIWNRYTDNKASWHYEVVEAGYKYNIPDILSAIGRVQLTRANTLLKMREELATLYDTAFKDDEHFSIPPTERGDARHLYPLRLNLEKLSVTRNEFIEKIKNENIGVSVHFIPLHTMPYYKKQYKLQDDDFPETINSFNREISLPLWPGMGKSQIERVATVIKKTAKENSK